MNYTVRIKQYRIKTHIQMYIHDITDQSFYHRAGILFQLHDDCYRTICKFCENDIANFLEDNGYVIIITKDVYNDKHGNYTFQLTPKSLLEVL